MTVHETESVLARGGDRADVKVRAGRWGLHLFDRRSGLNVLLDEVRVPQQVWSAAPRQVSVALTNACDLACSYCYAPKRPARLDARRLLEWLRDLDAHGCLGVGFGGGEPTLYRGFAEVCRRVATETAMAVSFTTHGHRLDEQLCADLAGHVHFIRISVDGVAATYERVRGRSFSSLRRGLELAGTVAPIGINYVVNASTLPDLDAAVEVASESAAREFLLLPEQPVDGAGGIDEETIRGLRRWVERYTGGVPLVVSEAGADGLPACAPLHGELPLEAYVHIDAMGLVKPSSYDGGGVPVGTDGVMAAIEQIRAQRKEDS